MEPLFQLSISISLKSYSKKYFRKKYRKILGLSMSICVSMRPMPGRTKCSREKGAKVFFAALMHIRLKYKRRSRLKDNTLNIPRKSFLSFLLVIDDTAYKNTTIRHKQKTFPKSFFIFTCQKNICTAKSLWEILIHSIFVYRILKG